MIGPSPLSRMNPFRRRMFARIKHPAAIIASRGGCHHRRPMMLPANHHKHHYFSSTAANSSISDAEIANGDGKTPTAHKARPRYVSFFDEVDEIMKRNSPLQYQRFLESKAASESRRHIQDRNEQSRKRYEGDWETAVDPKAPNEYSMEIHDNANNISDGGESKAVFPVFDEKVDLGGEPEDMRRFNNNTGMSDFAHASNRGEPNNPFANSAEGEVTKPELASNRNDVSSTGGTLLEGTSEAIPPKSDDETPTKKTGGIFSSISKSALNMRDANGKTSTNIPLSELFPTLYGNKQKEDSTPKRHVNPAMMYDTENFEAYEQALKFVLDDSQTGRTQKKYASKSELNRRVVQKVRDWLLSDHRVIEAETVRDRWNNLEEAWKNEKWMTGVAVAESDDDATVGKSKFELELKEQRELFLSKLMSDEVSSTLVSTADLASVDQLSEEPEGENDALKHDDIDPTLFYDSARHLLAALGKYCARRARPSPMEVAWWKVKESGMMLSKDIISTYLYVVSTMGMAESLGIGSGIKEERCSTIPEEIATYHDLASKPTESSISLRVKALAVKGDAHSAETLLEAFRKSIEADKSSKEILRLRTYIPILKQYCDKGEIGPALSVFKRMQTTPGVVLEPENYILLLSAIAENKYFCMNSPPIEGALDIGYSHTHGPKLFDEITAEMALETLEISSSSARRLYNALAKGFQSNESDSDDENAVLSDLKEAHPLMSMPITNQRAGDNELVASRVNLDQSTGVCPVTNAQQRLLVLEPDQRKQLHSDLLDLSSEQFAKYTGKKSYKSDIDASEQLQIFSDWLDKREGRPFTAIVDGANIGYYMQSFDKGRFNYHQIKFMVDELEERGENALVIIPNKYGKDRFYASMENYQHLSRAEIEIRTDLEKRGKLWKVPPQCLDDFYWMLASISDQTSSRKGADLSVSNDDPGGRFPGARPMLISNDQMRDHRMELLDPRLFRRWYGCHIVNYNFTAFVLDESVANNYIAFSQADYFSREIQCNESPTEGGKWRGRAWHFPVSDWDLDERFVVRIPERMEGDGAR